MPVDQIARLNPGRRIRALVGVIVAVYLLLALVWWSGLGAVHADVLVEASSSAAAGRQEALLRIANDSPTSFTVERIELIDGRFRDIDIPRTVVDAGDTAAVPVAYSADCGASRPFPNAPVVVVHVRTALGLDRRVHEDSAFAMEC